MNKIRPTHMVFILQAFFAIFLLGASRIIIKQSLVYSSPYLLAGLVQAAAFVLLLIHYILRRDRPVLPKNPIALSALTLISLVGFAGAPLFVIIGMQYTSGVVAGLFAGLGAILTTLLGIVILREAPKGSQIAGIAAAIIGALLFVTQAPGKGMLFGMALLLLAESGFALTTVLMRGVILKYKIDPSLVSLCGSFVGALILMPAGLLISGAPIWSVPLILAVIILGLIYAFATSLWYDALKYLKAFEASVINSTILLQVALLAVIFLGEKMSGQEVLAGLLITVGAAIVEFHPLSKVLVFHHAKS